MKVGDLVRWNRNDCDLHLNLPWFATLMSVAEKQGIVVEVDDAGKYPSVVTVLWDINSGEKIFADELEVINESR